MTMNRSTLRVAVLSATLAAGIAVALPSGASAEVRTGWIGPTPPVGGIVYLHTSTIDNGGVPKASTRIYTSFGQTVVQGTIGSKARLFREGALCSATDYQFNAFLSSSQNATVQRDCGPGFYNSHGFVATFPPGGSLTEYVTFPSDPLQYAPASARSAAPAAQTESGVNTSGQTYGSALNAESDADLPELVSAVGTNGVDGYIRSSDLTDPTPDDAGSRSVPVYDISGETVVDQFAIEGS
ncbi:hypothetical protein J2W54_002906 [Rhodococcus fascians]|uniref:hypothetical protein n=1 Tax=Nocardiaceae TaxID=85025 RepID=UPI00068FBB63|nr:MULTISPECIES: hypothetical protein [Rhodococcus]MDR6910953.1 hypothetical protein [Rhodococcus sp. 3258]MDR6932512.1 hypothetical protein [Rhodococcus fascians]RYG95360.1 MAG: hypothetical protein EON58_14335 [Alphaproteobacteria bacterium]